MYVERALHPLPPVVTLFEGKGRSNAMTVSLERDYAADAGHAYRRVRFDGHLEGPERGLTGKAPPTVCRTSGSVWEIRTPADPLAACSRFTTGAMIRCDGGIRDSC